STETRTVQVSVRPRLSFAVSTNSVSRCTRAETAPSRTRLSFVVSYTTSPFASILSSVAVRVSHESVTRSPAATRRSDTVNTRQNELDELPPPPPPVRTSTCTVQSSVLPPPVAVSV